MSRGPRVVLFGWGNPSRGDDALGPLLVERAERWLAGNPDRDVTVVGDFQLQIEHALDVDGAELVLFVDADAGCEAPFELASVGPSEDASFSTHELSPAALLEVYRKTTGREPPPARVLGVRGERFELGEPLSPEGERNLEAAWRALEGLLREAGEAEAFGV